MSRVTAAAAAVASSQSADPSSAPFSGTAAVVATIPTTSCPIRIGSMCATAIGASVTPPAASAVACSTSSASTPAASASAGQTTGAPTEGRMMATG